MQLLGPGTFYERGPLPCANLRNAVVNDRILANQGNRRYCGMGGVFVGNPFTMTAFGGNRIIAHPLGGCAMGETEEQGVVALDGRVFDPTKGPRGVHDGLYVCDGAAVPSAIGVSPLLTITALAERAMILAAEQLQRKLDICAMPARPMRDATMDIRNSADLLQRLAVAAK